VGSGVTGRGANLIIIDDPVKSREEAESEAYRRRVWNWYRDDMYTRLEPNGAIILIQTRWHEADLAGRLLDEAKQGGEAWEVVNLPALADPDDPLGRLPGAALCPERFDVPALERIRGVLGTYSFEALYQQRPRPAEGALFKRQWFKVADKAPDGLRWVRYWDLAASTRSQADYTASAAVALAEDGTLYIRDMLRGRWEWPDAYNVIANTMQAERNVTHGIEKALHGLAAVQQLQRDPRLASISFRGVDVDRDKYSRALAWAGRAETGKVTLIQGAWIGAFLDEVCAFPLGAHDDQVDTISGGAQLLSAGVVTTVRNPWN
jgi:predicted phage terminase large subunit-like protein